MNLSLIISAYASVPAGTFGLKFTLTWISVTEYLNLSLCLEASNKTKDIIPYTLREYLNLSLCLEASNKTKDIIPYTLRE